MLSTMLILLVDAEKEERKREGEDHRLDVSYGGKEESVGDKRQERAKEGKVQKKRRTKRAY